MGHCGQRWPVWGLLFHLKPRCHPFQNNYTHEVTIFKWFRGLQLQLSGVCRMNLDCSYSFLVLCVECIYRKEFPSRIFKNLLQLQLSDLQWFPNLKCNVFEKNGNFKSASCCGNSLRVRLELIRADPLQNEIAPKSSQLQNLECRKWGFKRWGFKQIRGYLRKKALFQRFLDFPGAVRALRKRAKTAERGRKRPKEADFGRFPGREARPRLNPHLLHPH